MRKIQKYTALALSLSALYSLAACGTSSRVKNTPDTVQFYFWQSGYGVDYIKNLVNAYNRKQDKFTVELEYTANQATITSTLESGEANTYDLYMVPVLYEFQEIFENLDDVLDFTNEGESKTIREKLRAEELGVKTRADGKVYDLPYGDTMVGLFYNKSIIDGGKYSLPRTTDELETLVWDMQGDGITPFVHFADGAGNGYYSYLYNVWHAQYDGLDYYRNNFLQMKDSSGNSPSKAVFTEKDGRWKTLKVMESILTKDTVTDASNEQEFTTAQTSLFNGDAAMMVNGTWLKNEMSAKLDNKVEGYGVNENIVMMKTPVISDIVEKLEYDNMKDSQLSAVIKAIDEKKDYEATRTATGLSALTEKDYNRIREARTLRYNSIKAQNFFIPNYSNAIEGAKDFMKYMYSDEGLLIYMQTVHLRGVAELDDPSGLDMSAWTAWDKYHYELKDEYENVLFDSQKVCPLFSVQQLDPYANIGFIPNLTAKGTQDILSAQAIWDKMTKYIDQQWDYWVKE